MQRKKIGMKQFSPLLEWEEKKTTVAIWKEEIFAICYLLTGELFEAFGIQDHSSKQHTISLPDCDVVRVSPREI